MEIISHAGKVFKQNFKMKTCFERAIFFSWYCSTGDCKFCYMSTQNNPQKTARRSVPSLLAELIISKKQGWDIGFLSGGHDAYNKLEFKKLLKDIYKIYGEKIWINVGPVSKDELKEFQPYIKGVVGSIETVNPVLHDELCPSKPVRPFIEMFNDARKLGLERAMTIIVGLGETKRDFSLLERFIKENEISKIHIYSLNPQKGTVFEGKPGPSQHYQSWWIAKTRIAFPKIDIQAGIWADKVGSVSLLLNAGANSISKFPALRKFNSEQAKQIESEAKMAGREFIGSLTKMADINPDKETDDKKIKEKLKQYLKSMTK